MAMKNGTFVEDVSVFLIQNISNIMIFQLSCVTLFKWSVLRISFNLFDLFCPPPKKNPTVGCLSTKNEAKKSGKVQKLPSLKLTACSHLKGLNAPIGSRIIFQQSIFRGDLMLVSGRVSEIYPVVTYNSTG